MIVSESTQKERSSSKTVQRYASHFDTFSLFTESPQDTLKVSGLQVSPAEIESTILTDPSNIVSDVAVAGVQLPTARTTDDKAPRAWVVLTQKGKEMGEAKAMVLIEERVKKTLSKYKWLRGGVEIIDEIPKNPTGE